MRSSIRFTASLLLGTLAIPASPAGAQVYPERIRIHSAVVAKALAGRVQRQRETQTERITRTIRLGDAGELDISNISGDVVITRGGGDSAAIEIIKTGRGTTVEEAKEMLQLVPVDIIERAGRVEIRSRFPRNTEMRRQNRRNVNVDVAVNVTAPERTRVTINTISGSVRIKDIKGDQTIETISGNIAISNAGRLSKASSVSGNVEIIDTSLDGALEASTISGTVLLRNVKAQQVDLGSISGDVRIENVSSERVEAQAISGNVTLSGPLTRGGRYDLGSHSGEVHAIISGDVGFEIEASSFSGNVRPDPEIKLTGVSSATNRRGGQRSLRGTYGDGSAFLDLTTFSGSVIVTKR